MKPMAKAHPKASKGKRLFLLALGGGFLVLSLYLPFVPVQDDKGAIVCKWAVNILFFVGSILLLYAGARAERRQVDKAIDSIIRGL
jgi:hypothetical protein